MAIKDALQQYPDQTEPFYEFQFADDLQRYAGAIGLGENGENNWEKTPPAGSHAQAALGIAGSTS